jgi:nitrogen regulatory protein PII-like uncharacterized protein
MKISYVLLNKTGKDRGVPRGAAWQWIHEVNDEEQMQSVFERLKKRTSDEQLTVANLRVNQREYAEAFADGGVFGFKGPVVYDKTIAPKRIIHLQAEADEDTLQVA